MRLELDGWLWAAGSCPCLAGLKLYSPATLLRVRHSIAFCAIERANNAAYGVPASQFEFVRHSRHAAEIHV